MRGEELLGGRGELRLHQPGLGLCSTAAGKDPGLSGDQGWGFGDLGSWVGAAAPSLWEEEGVLGGEWSRA